MGVEELLLGNTVYPSTPLLRAPPPHPHAGAPTARGQRGRCSKDAPPLQEMTLNAGVEDLSFFSDTNGWLQTMEAGACHGYVLRASVIEEQCVSKWVWGRARRWAAREVSGKA